MAISTSAVTLTTTPQKITNDFTGRNGCTLYVSNPSSSVDVYLSGSASSTTADSFILYAKTVYQSSNILTIKLEDNEDLYAFVGTGTLAIRVMHQGD
jgi:hypothetical protein